VSRSKKGWPSKWMGATVRRKDGKKTATVVWCCAFIEASALIGPSVEPASISSLTIL